MCRNAYQSPFRVSASSCTCRTMTWSYINSYDAHMMTKDAERASSDARLTSRPIFLCMDAGELQAQEHLFEILKGNHQSQRDQERLLLQKAMVYQHGQWKMTQRIAVSMFWKACVGLSDRGSNSQAIVMQFIRNNKQCIYLHQNSDLITYHDTYEVGHCRFCSVVSSLKKASQKSKDHPF